MPKTLFEEVRSEQNLFSAWRHVKKSALSSSQPKIRGKAAEFEHSHQRHLKTIAAQLREDRFKFDSYEGVLKDRRVREAAGKAPRPIAIGTIRNRVVQRAILQVLQPRKLLNSSSIDPKFELISDPRLGKINSVNKSEIGVGGLLHPYGGVKPAVLKVLDAMKQGKTHYYRSDIKAFFTKIPTNKVLSILSREIKDPPFLKLFSDALEVRLENSEELMGYADIFPKNGIGVAQGGSLSAFAGNVLLYEFDHALEKMGVAVVRYIDDLFILADSQTELDAAIEYSRKSLSAMGLELYPPVKGSDKAEMGLCANSFGLLGCTIQPNRAVPSKASKKRAIETVGEHIRKSKKFITNNCATTRDDPTPRHLPETLMVIKKYIYGWQKSYDFCTEPSVFKELDASVETMIFDYWNWYVRKAGGKYKTSLNLLLGLPSTHLMWGNSSAK